MMMIKSVDDFLDSPLAVWAKSLSSTFSDDDGGGYDNFPNGQYFYHILKQADTRLQNLQLPNEGDPYDTTRSRLLNLDFILRNIRSFYQDALSHILLAKLPDIYQIAKYPESEETYKEMEKMLVLLLGIAINGDMKETFIDQIQQKLDTNLQMELVPFIKVVNDDISFSISRSLLFDLDAKPTVAKQTDQSSTKSNGQVLAYQSVDEINYFMNQRLLPNLQRLVDERDSYLEHIIELQQDKDFLTYKLNGVATTSNITDTPTNNSATASTTSNQASFNDKQFLIDALNVICSNTTSNSVGVAGSTNDVESTSSLVNLSDKQTLMKLIESIYKEISITNNYIEVAADSIQTNLAENHDNEPTTSTTSASTKTKSSLLLLNDLKTRKLLTNNWNQKIAIELVECKIKLKQLVNEIEEKCEQIETLKDEIDDVKKQISKLRNENVELQQKATLANVYSDELESLREKSLKVDRYESEIGKLKERIEELQESKSRLEELREENLILIETRSIMEKQLNEYQVRLLASQRVDSDLNKYKQEVDDLLSQRELDKRRLCELCEKNAKLELDMKNLLNQNVTLDEELNYYKQQYTFILGKHEQMMQSNQQTAQSQLTQLIETNKLKLSEYEHVNAELTSQLKQRDADMSRLKESLRLKEINLDECMVKMRVVSEELANEHETRVKCEKTLEQHKLEIKELQVKLDDCVSETKKLDVTIREVAMNSEQKETENQENVQRLISSHEQLNESYKKLLVDHEQLQKIYLQMEIDYEELYGELTKKHGHCNGLSIELDEAREKLNECHKKIEQLQVELNKYKEKIMIDVSIGTDQTIKDMDTEKKRLEEFYDVKFKELNSQINDLTQKKQSMESKVMTLGKDLDMVNSENAELKKENKNYMTEMSKQREQTQFQSLQLTQYSEKIQTLENMNEKLEEEKSQLFEQLNILLQQNQEILTQTLNSKDMYHEETKAYLQQLNNLKRQKEILEQKIMEQYKACPSSTSKKSKKSSPNNNNNCVHNSSSTPGANNHGIMDNMFSKTRQLVQKVRNKSANSSLNTSQSNGQSIYASSQTAEHLIANHILNDDSDLLPTSGNQISYDPSAAYSQKYAEDAVSSTTMYYKQRPTPQTPSQSVKSGLTGSVTMNCLSSSLSSSSSTTSSSSYTAGSQQDINNSTSHMLSESRTPIKLDPKSLRLGGRSVTPQVAVCLTTPTKQGLQQQMQSPSPSVVKVKQHMIGEFNRPGGRLPTSQSQPFISTNGQSHSSTVSTSTTQSPSSSSSTSSCSSSSGVSSTSLNLPKPTPLGSICSRSPISVIVNKSNTSLLTTKSPNGIVKTKIGTKLADSLNKLRLSEDYYETACQHETEDESDEEDEEESEMELTSHFNKSIKNVSIRSKTSSNEAKFVATANNTKTTNEIWLEYGCI